jgi:hypothetical protein
MSRVEELDEGNLELGALAGHASPSALRAATSCSVLHFE